MPVIVSPPLIGSKPGYYDDQDLISVSLDAREPPFANDW